MAEDDNYTSLKWSAAVQLTVEVCFPFHVTAAVIVLIPL